MDNTLITEDRLNAIINLARMSPKKGLVVELGVYKGGSLVVIANEFPNQTVIGFDTFEGLPTEHWTSDEKHNPKDFDDTSLEEVRKFVYDENQCKNVLLVKGLFPESGEPFKDKKFSFVHVDFDFYMGAKAALDFFWNKLEKGGIMVFDDYGWENCPGVKKALDEFKPAKAFITASYQAAIIKN